MAELMQASHQWASRPADERFTSLTAMQAEQAQLRRTSRQLALATRRIEAIPSTDHKGIMLRGPDGGLAAPSHWAFGQLAGLAEAPARYLRTIPAELVADCINYGLQYKRDVEDVGLLLSRKVGEDAMPVTTARAVTGPQYGRIWNSEIIDGLINRFGDGTPKGGGDWTVPGTFGRQLAEVTKENTTLFAGDRDMFVFLADEQHKVEVSNRRDGQPGALSRGFFVKNSEVGAATLEIHTFLFDYVCCNRIVWGASEHKKIAIRHTPKAPVRWADEVAPALDQYLISSTGGIEKAIQRAQAARLDNVEDFLAKRFGKRMPAMLQDISVDEEGRPIETIWDAVCAATAYARTIKWQDDRVEFERAAGSLLDLAA